MQDTSSPASVFPSSLGEAEADAEYLKPFEQNRLLEVHGKPFRKDRSFYDREPFTRTHYHHVGRGTRCFVTFESQRRQRCLFKDIWRVGEVQAMLHERTYPKVPASDDVLDHRYSSRRILSESDCRQHTRSRIILAPVWTPVPDFPSTHAFVSCIYNAVLAHKAAYTLLPDVNRPEISVDNIVFAQEPDGACTGLLVDWDLAKCGDNQTKEYRQTRTRHFMAARLCNPSPPPRTVGDDLESFVLVLLWTAARYAPNNMTPSERGSLVEKFDITDGWSKSNMIRSGTSTVIDLKLESSEFGEVLEDIMMAYCARYEVLTTREKKNLEVVEELERRQALLEHHDWFVDILSTALQNEAWANENDGSRKEETVEVPPPRCLRMYRDDWFQ